MERLLCPVPEQRLGFNGADEVKDHPFFQDINWETLLSERPAFVPAPAGVEDTDYFDVRGAKMGSFKEDIPELKDVQSIAQALSKKESLAPPPRDSPEFRPRQEEPATTPPALTVDTNVIDNNSTPRAHTPKHHEPDEDSKTADSAKDETGADFGTFAFINLPVLEKANNDMIRKLRSDNAFASASGSSLSSSISEFSSETPGTPGSNGNQATAASISKNKHRSMTALISTPPLRFDGKNYFSYSPKGSPGSSGSAGTSNSQNQGGASTPQEGSEYHPQRSSSVPVTFGESSKDGMSPTELTPVSRRSSMPLRPRTHSASNADIHPFAFPGSSVASPTSSTGPTNKNLPQVGSTRDRRSGSMSSNSGLRSSRHSLKATATLRSTAKGGAAAAARKTNRTRDCLIVDDNPISAKILETILTRLNCRCVIMRNGGEAIRCAMGTVKFDIIFMDIRMPISKLI